MTLKQATPLDLCRRLADGWTKDNADVPRELVARLTGRWKAQLAREESYSSCYHAVFDINQLHFLGASAMGCLVLSPGASIENEFTSFWEQHGGSGRLTIILAATTTIKEAVQRLAPLGRSVILGNGEIENLLTHPRPIEILKEYFLRQIPHRKLLPYDVTHPVAPNMFFGRRNILERLHQEETRSFAIAGPGRIGKSSILRQYSYEIRLNRRDNRRDNVRLIDCYPYGRLPSDELARTLAIDISAESYAHHVNASTLLRFMKRRSSDALHPLELLLDEVDVVCLNEVFNELAESVRAGYCRVIMCGRGNLYRMMRDKTHQFEDRLELIRPEPLDPSSARDLLLKPLADLGIAPEDEAACSHCVLELSGRRPHLIQYCADKLFQSLENEQVRTVNSSHLAQLRDHFLSLSSTMLPLDDMKDDLTRLIALLWLRGGATTVTVASLQGLAATCGIKIDATKALDICDDLWICNLLSIEHGTFVIANRYLTDFVRRMDFTNEIERLKRAVVVSLTESGSATN